MLQISNDLVNFKLKEFSTSDNTLILRLILQTYTDYD